MWNKKKGRSYRKERKKTLLVVDKNRENSNMLSKSVLYCLIMVFITLHENYNELLNIYRDACFSVDEEGNGIFTFSYILFFEFNLHIFTVKS